MSTVPSPDAKAVVRAAEALTTQVRRIADALSTPVAIISDGPDDAPTTATDDGRHVPLSTPCASCSHPFNWHEAGVCQVSRCACIAFAVGQRPEPMDPVHILGTEAPAADEDAQRSARAVRREQLRVLLARADRGSLGPDEVVLLRQFVDAEINEGAALRGDVKWLGQSRRTWKGKAEEIERIRDNLAAELRQAEADRDRLRTAWTSARVRARDGWAEVDRTDAKLARVRRALDPDDEAYIRETVDEQLALRDRVTKAEREARAAQATIKRVRGVPGYVESVLAQSGPGVPRQAVQGIADRLRAALDATEQPTEA